VQPFCCASIHRESLFRLGTHSSTRLAAADILPHARRSQREVYQAPVLARFDTPVARPSPRKHLQEIPDRSFRPQLTQAQDRLPWRCAYLFPPAGYLLCLVVVLGLDLLLLMYCRPRCGTGSWVFHTKVNAIAFSCSVDEKIFQSILAAH
jgi:hypothetical protein